MTSPAEPVRATPWRDAVALLTAYAPADLRQSELRTAYLEVLVDDRAVFKSGPPVHLTASCLVLDHRSERVLLTLHAKARSWLQFGGHIEPGDETVYAAARREVAEESGIDGVEVEPHVVELHRHRLGARFGRCVEHLDVRFVGWAPPGAEAVPSAESLDVRWWPLEALPEGVVTDLGDLIRRGQERASERSRRSAEHGGERAPGSICD